MFVENAGIPITAKGKSPIRGGVQDVNMMKVPQQEHYLTSVSFPYI
jgi:hypothetical protein